MPSKEAEKYVEKLVLSKYTESETIPNITQRYYSYEDMLNAFDAGIDSVNKKVGDVNDYYDNLSTMSEDYQKGYIQAEKDMPKQFEAVHDIITLQKELDALKSDWHNLKENPKDLPVAQAFEDQDHWKWYLVKTDYTTYKSCGYAVCARVLMPNYSSGEEYPTWIENDGMNISDEHIFEWRELK